VSDFWQDSSVVARSGLDEPPGTLERLDRFRALQPNVDITGPRFNGLGAWQACWIAADRSDLTVTRKTCAEVLDDLRKFFPEWEPKPKPYEPDPQS
jgi:hypothetical protein